MLETESGGNLEAEIEPFDDPAQAEQIREMLEMRVPPPDCGGGIPGEHCSF